MASTLEELLEDTTISPEQRTALFEIYKLLIHKGLTFQQAETLLELAKQMIRMAEI